jgi:predicted HTH domain antitoxin
MFRIWKVRHDEHPHSFKQTKRIEPNGPLQSGKSKPIKICSRFARSDAMTVSFELPPSIEEIIAGLGPDLAATMKEAALVDLFRRELISHGQFAKALNLARYEADGVLKRHGVLLQYTDEEFDAEMEYLRGLVTR